MMNIQISEPYLPSRGGGSRLVGDVMLRGFPHPEPANQQRGCCGNSKLKQSKLKTLFDTWLQVASTPFHLPAPTLSAKPDESFP